MVFNPFGKNRLKISWERRKKNIIYVEAFERENGLLFFHLKNELFIHFIGTAPLFQKEFKM
jgi:hypothetical protein